MENFPILPYNKMEEFGDLLDRAYRGDAGLDLCASRDCVIVGLITILRLNIGHVGDMHCDVPTGIAVEIPTGCVGLVLDKSSRGKQRLMIFGRVIDSSYRGSIVVMMSNFGETLTIRAGEKIAQLVIMPIHRMTPRLITSLSETDRGDRGFGSSGGINEPT